MTRAYHSAGQPADDRLLTLTAVAVRLKVSRPYVSMLCDAGKLGHIVVTEDGHRRIRASAVDAYLTARNERYERAPSPREAGVDAGLYDHPDAHFQNKIRQDGTATPTGSPSAEPHPKSRP